MEIKNIHPIERAHGIFSIPGSKSYTNRALLCAALADGNIHISDYSHSEDSELMFKAIKGLVVQGKDWRDFLVYEGHGWSDEEKRSIQSRGLQHLIPSGSIYTGAAGTVMSFMAALCSCIKGEHLLSGTDSLNHRPLEDLVDALNPIIDGDIRLFGRNKEGKLCPPVKIDAKGLIGGETSIRVDSSSQYLSALLMVAPYAKDDVIIRTEGQMVEAPYVDMTLEVMKHFGVDVEKTGCGFHVQAGQRYRPTAYTVESDASGATYFMAAAAITGGETYVGSFDHNSKQGDLRFTELLKKMGCKVDYHMGYYKIQGPEKLKAIETDMTDMPDTVQTLAILAATAEGVTDITGIKNLRIKETDRISALEQELNKVGIETESTEGSLKVYGGNPKGAEIRTYDDHRMAMSFSVLGLKVPGISIQNPDCVKKSFPGFYDLFDRLR